MKPVLQFLSPAEIEAVHEAALQLLQNQGMQMPSEEALSILKGAGAKIEDNNIAKIPPHLVEYAVKHVPKRQEVVLYGREPENDIKFDVNTPVLANMTEATHIIDPVTRKRRLATNDDLARLTRLVDHLEHVKINSPPVTPQDVPGEVAELYSWATSIKNTSKHITGAALGSHGVRDAIRMASIAAGGVEHFRERPFISFWVLTRPPLQIDRLTLEALIEMSRWKVPAIISSGPIVGITSPVSLAGTIVQAHAEILACLVVSQLVNPGAPVVYTSFARSMDMKTGSVCMSSPEFAILKGAMGQMGRFLGMPVRMPAMLRDAKILDAQAGFETGMTGTICTLAADIFDAMQFDMDIVVDFADFVFCNECMGALKRISKELVVNTDTIALDTIKEVGHGGNFLKHKHTFKHFRQEIWQSQLMERRSWAGWEKAGAQEIKQVTLQKALEILEKEPVKYLSPAAEAEIDKIVQEAQVDYTRSI